MKNVFTLLLAAALVAAPTFCAISADDGDLQQLMDSKVSIPGHGQTPYSWREVFMDITVGSVSYALPDFSSFALSSPTLAKGAAQAYFQHERTIAYKNYERAMQSGNQADQRYYEGVISRMEAAVTWVSTGDGTELRNLLAKKNQEAGQKEDSSPPSTVSAGGKITATGPFTQGVRGVPYRDKYVTLSMGLDPSGVPVCYGKGYIKVSQGGDEWIDYFFTLRPGEPAVADPSKSYSSFPTSYAWKGKGTLEIRYGPNSWKSPFTWQASLEGDTVTGDIDGFFNFLSNKVPFDFLIYSLPEPLPFEVHFFDPSSGSGNSSFLRKGSDPS